MRVRAAGCDGGLLANTETVRPARSADGADGARVAHRVAAQHRRRSDDVPTACAASAQAIGGRCGGFRKGGGARVSGGAHAMTARSTCSLRDALALSSRSDDRSARRAPRSPARRVHYRQARAPRPRGMNTKRRGARIYSELVGYGSANDAYRVTDMHPGRGAPRARSRWRSRTRESRREVGYVNAHDVDDRERSRQTLALKKAFGDDAPNAGELDEVDDGPRGAPQAPSS